jgi:hypothetical protein
MLKLLSSVLLSVAVLLASSSTTHADGGQSINKFLNNQVIVSRQIMCVLEKGPCDQLGRQLKGES